MIARPRELNCNRYSTVQLCTGERDLLAKMMRCGCEEEWRSWVERKVKRDATRLPKWQARQWLRAATRSGGMLVRPTWVGGGDNHSKQQVMSRKERCW